LKKLSRSWRKMLNPKLSDFQRLLVLGGTAEDKLKI
jgi:hypothetical protein